MELTGALAGLKFAISPPSRRFSTTDRRHSPSTMPMRQQSSGLFQKPRRTSPSSAPGSQPSNVQPLFAYSAFNPRRRSRSLPLSAPAPKSQESASLANILSSICANPAGENQADHVEGWEDLRAGSGKPSVFREARTSERKEQPAACSPYRGKRRKTAIPFGAGRALRNRRHFRGAGRPARSIPGSRPLYLGFLPASESCESRRRLGR